MLIGAKSFLRAAPNPPDQRDHKRSEQDGAGPDHDHDIRDRADDEHQEQPDRQRQKAQPASRPLVLVDAFHAEPHFPPDGLLGENAIQTLARRLGTDGRHALLDGISRSGPML